MLQRNLNGAIFHNRCACYILNLIVQKGLKLIKHTLQAVKHIVGYIFLLSPTRKQQWKDICESLNKRQSEKKNVGLTR